MKILKYKNFFLFVIMLFFLSCPSTIFAIEKPVLSFEGQKNIDLGENFNLKVIVSSEDLLNAFDVELTFPKDKVEFLGFNNAGSIIELWQNNPTVIDGNKIKFAGGLFQAFKGQSGLLVSLKFKSLSVGNIDFSLSKAEMYMADGKGTLTQASTKDFSVSVFDKEHIVSEQETLKISEEYNFDTSVPVLVAEIVRTNKVRLISFNAVDKESGIKRIEMRSKKWLKYGSWQEVVNPVIYPKDAWAVEIKAINNQNLESIVQIHKYLNLFYKILIPILLIVTLGRFLVYNKGTRR